MARQYPVLAGIDIGSSKTAVLLCEISPQGLEIIGFGQSESHGVRKGVVVNIDSTILSLQEALREAQKLAQREIDYAVTGVSGAPFQCMGSQGMIPLRDQEVRAQDIRRVLDTAATVSLPLDREIVQVIPQDYCVDGQEGILDPLGMFGKRLEVNVQIVTGSISSLENIRRCLSKAGLQSHRFISTSVASARAVAAPDEKEAGVAIVDIGAATTDIAVYQAGCLRWIRSLPVGGMHLTNDLAVGLKMNLKDAEVLKCRMGCPSGVNLEELVEIPSLSGGEPRQMPRRMVSTVLQPRLDEILHFARQELAKEGVDEVLPSGVVLTGGVTHLQGILESAERVFRLPVRLGRPTGLGGLSDMVSSPSYSSLVGLVQLGYEESEELQYESSLFDKRGMSRFHAKVSRWMKDFF
jgi:cell division protein FtsA